MPATSIKTDNKIQAPIGLTTKLFFGLDSETLSNYGYEKCDLSYIKSSDYRESRRITGTKSREETIFTYLHGHKLEQDGRHYKRLAIAEEKLSGRCMKQWCEAVKLAEGTMRELLTECKTFGLLNQGEEKEPINITPEEESSDMSEELTPEQFSQSVPTARAEKALRKAEDETVKQVKVGAANGETYTEKEIKKIDKEVKQEKEEARKAELTPEELAIEKEMRSKKEATLSAIHLIERFFDNTDQLLNTMHQIHPNILNLIEMKKLKELSEKMENLDESIYEAKGNISDALAAKAS